MPNPKDPQKLQEYREKMSRIAKERGYGRWMTGKKASEETLERMRQSQQALITPEECKRRSERAKEQGYGKWMVGKILSKETREKIASCRKGKTYNEIYGEKAEEETEKRKASNKSTSKRKVREGNWPPPKFLSSSRRRAGKTYKEIYGERAEEESQKRSESHQRKWRGKLRLGCRDKINGETRYKRWRTVVFSRDNYTCRSCYSKGGRLHAHHIKPWAMFPDLRYEVDNGLTLCVLCHAEKHPANKGLILG